MIFCSLITPEAKSPMHTITIGVDLAKLAFSACAVDERGAVTQRRDLRRDAFAVWLAQWPAGSMVDMQACHHRRGPRLSQRTPARGVARADPGPALERRQGTPGRCGPTMPTTTRTPGSRTRWFSGRRASEAVRNATSNRLNAKGKSRGWRGLAGSCSRNCQAAASFNLPTR